MPPIQKLFIAVLATLLLAGAWIFLVAPAFSPPPPIQPPPVNSDTLLFQENGILFSYPNWKTIPRAAQETVHVEGFSCNVALKKELPGSLFNLFNFLRTTQDFKVQRTFYTAREAKASFEQPTGTGTLTVATHFMYCNNQWWNAHAACANGVFPQPVADSLNSLECNSSESIPFNSIPLTFSTRPFLVGTNLHAWNTGLPGLDDAWVLAQENAELYSISVKVPWKDYLEDFTPKDLEFIGKGKEILFAQAIEMKTLVLVEALNADRNATQALPIEWQDKNWNDTNLRQSFKINAAYLAKDLNVDYMVAAREVNLFNPIRAEDFGDLLSIYTETHGLIKKQGWKAQTGLSIDWDAEAFKEKHKPAHTLSEVLEKTKDKTDVLVLETRPFEEFSTSEEIPLDYYTRVRADYNGMIGLIVHGSPVQNEATRQSILERMAKDAADLNAVFLVYLPLHDSTEFPNAGLIDLNNQPKPAWNVWKSLQSIPYSGALPGKDFNAGTT
ncbi:MAG: hypothetical protein HY393_02350 [Candidatus Diapherotrites archaeon]|nr:hypothetical protein [Candidatus Diapherotrites archaeon]